MRRRLGPRVARRVQQLHVGERVEVARPKATMCGGTPSAHAVAPARAGGASQSGRPASTLVCTSKTYRSFKRAYHRTPERAFAPSVCRRGFAALGARPRLVSSRHRLDASTDRRKKGPGAHLTGCQPKTNLCLLKTNERLATKHIAPSLPLTISSNVLAPPPLAPLELEIHAKSDTHRAKMNVSRRGRLQGDAGNRSGALPFGCAWHFSSTRRQ